MGFGDAVKSGFAKYATFSGRAPRSEFWWWWLFSSLVYLAAVVLALILGGSSSGDGVSAVAIIIYLVAVLALILPSISVMVRRLHDIDRSGWWYWIGLVPCVGPIILIVFYVTPGTAGQNRFG
jgi:uncharacterized membrane protein YhaH (DUF805 family)